MTDEEMANKHAEEYVMREDVVTENDKVPFDNGYGFQTISFEDEVKKGYKDGFLAGLKAGRPQWHNLEKDPNDLPKDNENYICLLEEGYKFECYYDPTTKKWYDNFFHQEIEYGYYQSKVIAWYEIPTFDKEIEI